MTMCEVRLSPRAYCKMIMHAAKYPYAAVNGVFLAEETKGRKEKQTLFLVDAVPLFHVCLHLAPMAEIALTQIELFAASKGLIIAGYYQANEILQDLGMDKPAHRIADKIAENFSNACLIYLDNRKLTLGMEQTGINVMQCVDGKWKPRDRNSVELQRKEDSLSAASLLLQCQTYQQLIDFDNHLDSPNLNWTNPEVNESIACALVEAGDDGKEDEDQEEEGEEDVD